MKHGGKGREPLHVGIFVDSAGSYGRGLLEGIADYLLELAEPWSVFVERHATGTFDLNWIRRWRGNGILAFIEDPRAPALFSRLRIPIVETYGHLTALRVPQVRNDDEAIGRMSAEHLLARRFRHFAYIGYPENPLSERRRQGFVQTVIQAGCSCQCRDHPRSFPSLHSWKKAQGKLAAWLRRQPRPLGVMACSDRQAQRVLDACRRASALVPDEVSVIGVDNDMALCLLSQPSLSSVAENPRRSGFEAARLLDRIMRGEVSPAGDSPILIPPLGVITRRSTETTVTEDALVAEALRFIREHASENIDANTVLRHFSLSRSSFYLRFRKALGHPPHEEILRLRLDRLKGLLADFSAGDRGGIPPGRLRASRIHGRRVQAHDRPDPRTISGAASDPSILSLMIP